MSNISLKINSKTYSVSTDVYTLIQRCELLSIMIPRFSFHEKLSIAGNCRMCLVEVNNSPKPVVACSTKVVNNMVVLTNSTLIKQIREHIIEFLLINHPLDCPICDQGGECDLQDQTLIYGSDRGRFKEIKRSVLDKNFGPFIKTIMTRCIHCTKCVRFIEEYSMGATIGTLGRGGNTEIGLYNNHILKSELSGNIIDLCPVGALTSKPYAFRARSWELIGTESLDIFDSCGSNIIIQTRGNEILRILPKRNDNINESWITDQIRFVYDAFKKQRLLIPYIKNQFNNKLLPVSWKFGIAFFINNIVVLSKKKSNFFNHFSIFSGNMLDLESVFFIKQFSLQYNIININNTNWNNVNIRHSYIMDTKINEIEFNTMTLILGLDLKIESPIINLKIKKSTHSNSFVKNIIYYIGTCVNSNINSNQIGLSSKSLLSVLYAKNHITFFIKNSKKLSIFSRSDFKNAYSFNNIIPSSFFKISTNLICLNSGDINTFELNLQSPTKILINDFKKKTPSIFYFIEFDQLLNWNLETSSIFRVYQGNNFSENIIKYNLFLPSTNFTEGSIRLYMNCESRIQRAYPSVTSPGSSIKNSNIIYTIMLSLYDYNSSVKNSSFMNLEHQKSLMLWFIPSYKKSGLVEKNIFLLNNTMKENFWIKNINYIPTIKSFYNNNLYSRISSTLNNINLYRSIDTNFFNL